ncbi:MAG: hypothetical protein H0U81_11585 [Pyrinomonadaceae bacterium]|nr:hypothetical protein [Pyrinomonadaceae bacterium]
MNRLNTILRFIVIGLCLCSAFVLQGCGHHPSVSRVGSHRVTVNRSVLSGNISALHGTAGVEGEGNAATFRYSERRVDGVCYEVVIKADEMMLDGEPYGKLKEGDSVHINDDGITVNDMDYGDSEKYLKANGGQDGAVTLTHKK